jgi:hypothetical protein
VEAEFPVIPVKPGILSFFPALPPFGSEDSEVNQSLAGEFPYPAKREFAAA